MTPAPANAYALRKRDQLRAYTRRELAPHPCVRAVIAIGSVATGQARPDSDIDAVVFMDPVDLFVAPAEAIWRARDNSYHSIFTDDPTLELDGIQLDLHRLDLAVWRTHEHEWPEHVRAELADGWVVLDRTAGDDGGGGIKQLIRDRAVMADGERLAVLDDVLVEVAGLLRDEPDAAWSVFGPAEALDRLQAAWEGLARGLFAYERRWRPWRSRSLRGLLQLEHLPDPLSTALLTCVQSPESSLRGYTQRAQVLRDVFASLVARLRADGAYGLNPVSEAFVRRHDEPGRAWNIDDWNSQRHRPTRRTV